MLIILHPLFYLIIFAAIIHVYGGRQRRRWWIVWGILAYAVSLPFIPQALVRSLEFKYPPTPEVAINRSYHILVLGAGKNDDNQLHANQRLETVPLARLVEGVKWYHRVEEALLIGSGPRGRGDLSQAAIMKQTAEVLGVPADQIATLPNVKNTRTEARAYVDAFGTDTPLILCTSAIHMPRAVAWFQAHGVIEILPAPAPYLAPKAQRYTWRSFLPGISNLNLWQSWAKEVIGRWFVF